MEATLPDSMSPLHLLALRSCTLSFLGYCTFCSLSQNALPVTSSREPLNLFFSLFHPVLEIIRRAPESRSVLVMVMVMVMAVSLAEPSTQEMPKEVFAK